MALLHPEQEKRFDIGSSQPYTVIVGVALDTRTATVEIHVNTYVSKEAYVAGKDPIGTNIHKFDMKSKPEAVNKDKVKTLPSQPTFGQLHSKPETAAFLAMLEKDAIRKLPDYIHAEVE